MRVVFAGTPAFAVPSLVAVLEAGHVVPLVISQPDRPVGRGMALTPPPVKQTAVTHGLNVWQPDHLDPEALAERLQQARADALVVVALAHKIPPGVLDLPRYGCINVHASLLPRWRGAAPIAWALLEGDRITGVSVMRMDAGWDTGPVLLQRTELIRPDDTAASLHDRLSALGASLLATALAQLEAGLLAPLPQPDEGVRLAPRLTREQGLIRWELDAPALERQVRAFHPWPGAYTFLDGQRRVKILQARVETGRPPSGAVPGTIVAADPAACLLTVACGGGVLALTTLQPEGSRALSASDFINGYRVLAGQRFGGESP